MATPLGNLQVTPGTPLGVTLPGTSPTSLASPFTFSPASTGGQGAFGLVPGNVQSPLPGVTDLDSQAGSDIAAELGGTLSASTENALQNAAATFGATSGMPGSGLSWNALYGNIAGASEQQQQQGIGNLNSTFGPNAQVGLAQQNATNNAAPDPTESANYAEQLYNQYLNAMKGPQGGTGSNSGSPAGSTSTASATPPTPATPSALPGNYNFGTPDSLPSAVDPGLAAWMQQQYGVGVGGGNPFPGSGVSSDMSFSDYDTG